MKTINGLMKAFTLVFLCNFYLTGVLPYPWLVIVCYVKIMFSINISREKQQILCDSNGDCLSEEACRFIPITLFALSAISVVIAALDALQPANIAERIECLAHIFSGLIPRVVAGLLVALLQSEWSLILFLPVLVANCSFLSCFSKKPKTKTFAKVSSCSSIMVPVTMKPDISLKERGLEEEVDIEDRVTTKQTLGLLSIVNITAFILITSAFVATIYFLTRLQTDIDNYLNHTQMLQIFGFIFLPGSVLSIMCSLLIFFVPSVKLSEKHQTAKMVLDIIIIITAILNLIIPGIYLVSPGSQISFVFVKVSKKYLIFLGKILPVSNIFRSMIEWM